MDLLSKDEPLIDLNSFDSQEEIDGLLHNQRRLRYSSSGARNSSSRPNRMSLGSKVCLKELPPARKDHTTERHNSAIVSAVELTMKHYADSVLRVLEGMNGKLLQLELTAQDLEQTMTSLKVSIDDNHFSADRSFKFLNERVMETHRAIQILRDKQDIFEANEQLAKLQTSKALVPKESDIHPMDSSEITKASQQQEGNLKLPSQQPSQLILPPQQPSQHSLPTQQPSQQFVPPQQSLPSQQLIGQPQPPSSHPQDSWAQQPIQHPLPPQLLLPQPQPPSSQPQHSWVQQLAQHSLHPQQPSLVSLPPQQLMPQPQPPLPQPQHSWAQQYQVPSVQSQQQGSVELPYQLQPIQQSLPTQHPSQLLLPHQQPLQHPLPPQQTSQPSLSPQQMILQNMPQQASTQQSLPTQQPSQLLLPPQQPFQHPSPYQQPSKPLSSPQQMMQQTLPQQAAVQQSKPPTQQPGFTQQQPPSSDSRGSFQYYLHSNDAPSYASGTPSFAVGTEMSAASYAPHQGPFSSTQSHPSAQLPRSESFQHSHPQASQPLYEPHAATAGMSRPSTPMSFPHLRTAQPVRAHEHGSAKVNGIIEKVSTMGFSKEQVRSVMQRLAERNQEIDMNVVLDALMNGGRGR